MRKFITHSQNSFSYIIHTIFIDLTTCTFSVNSAFNNLRLLIPTEPKNRKLSKIETLRLAKSYISHLIAVLITGERHLNIYNHQGSILCENVFQETLGNRV